MVSILPSERSPWQVIDKAIGRNIENTLPQAVQQGYQRQLGMNALDSAQYEIEKANGDPYKIAMAFAKAGAQNPNLERSLGPLAQTAMQNSKVNRAFPQQSIGNGQQNQNGQQLPPQDQGVNPLVGQNFKNDFPTPTPFNIMTKDQMNAEAERWANAVQDPNGYNTRYNQLEKQNETAISQREALERAALNAGVDPGELPRFMVVNQGLNPANPSEWAQKAIRNFSEVKNNDDSIKRTFIPGLGNGLLGQNRDESLKRLEEPLRKNAERGLEQEDRKYLASQYVTPTEIERLYHPITEKLDKSISTLPKGLFPAQKKSTWGDVSDVFKGKMKTNPFVSYEEVKEKDPQALQVMQNRLSDFFLNNINEDSSLLAIREKLWDEKDYDWRQIGPAIREAEQHGLKLNERQQREMSTLETQPPIQSLPDIFKDLSRIPAFLRGAK